MRCGAGARRPGGARAEGRAWAEGRVRQDAPPGPQPTPAIIPFQIYYYADQIYLSAGVKSNDVQYVTVGTGAVNVLMTICTVSVPQREAPPHGKLRLLPG